MAFLFPAVYYIGSVVIGGVVTGVIVGRSKNATI